MKGQQIVTWMVGRDGDTFRSLCVEASSPKRQASFARRYTDVRAVSAPLGQTWDGKAMAPAARKVLLRGISRNRHAKPEETKDRVCPPEAMALLDEIAAHHGIDRKSLLEPPSRSHVYTRARGHAVHALKRRFNLSTTHIAEILNYADHSSVRYWLAFPIERMSRPDIPKDTSNAGQANSGQVSDGG